MEWLRTLKGHWLEILVPFLGFLVGVLWSAWRNQRKRSRDAAIWLQKQKNPHAVSFSMTGMQVAGGEVRLQLLSPGQGTTLSDLIGNEMGEKRVRDAADRCTPEDRVVRLGKGAGQRAVLKAVRDAVGAMFAHGSQAWGSGVPCRRVDWAACLTYDDQDPASQEEVSFRVEATPVRLLEWIDGHREAWRRLEPLPGEGHQKSRIAAEEKKATLWAEQQAGGAKSLIRVFSFWPEALFEEEDQLENRLEEALAATRDEGSES